MHKVAGPDAAFLYGERPEWHFHVSAVVVLEASADEPVTIDALGEVLRRRILERRLTRLEARIPRAEQEATDAN